ncbi:MAG: YggT family protein [Actinomycetota bacterium]
MAGILVLVLNLITFVFLAAALASWFRVSYDSPFRPVVDTLDRITTPVLEPIRRVIPPVGGFDLSVMVVILGIQLVLIPLVSSLG